MGVTAGIVEFGHFDNTEQEGPHLVRLRKADLQRRIKGQLTLRYKVEGLMSFAGLELVGRFIRRLDLRAILKGVEKVLPRSDFEAARLSLLVLTMLIAGARRVWQVEYLRDDPLVERLCGLGRLPSLHSLGRWLRGFDADGVKALVEVNERLVGDVIERSGLRRLTLDVDGSVVSTGFKVEGARRGFNPHRRKVPSYYPIMAYEANTGQVLRVRNRAGNVHDGKASVTFLEEVFAQLDATLERRPVLGASGCDGGVLRAVASRAGLVAPDACRGVPQARPSPEREELPARSVQPRRRLLRILGHRHQQGGDRADAMVLHVRPRCPREGLRRAQGRVRVRLRADPAL